MPDYFFKSFDIKHYRNFRAFTVPQLRRINVIGGMNGLGKTSLLEALFLFIDRHNPISITRAAQFRSLPISWASITDQLFAEGTNSPALEFSANTRRGKETVTIRYGTVRAPTTAQIQVPAGPATSTIGAGEAQQGFVITATVDGSENLRMNVTPAGPTANVFNEIAVVEQLPIAALVTPVTRYLVADLATRLTAVKQQGKMDALIAVVRTLQKDLKNLELLTIDGQAVIHADIGGMKQIPANFLGDGAFGLMATAIAIMSARDGVVLIDEIDAGLHYSKQKEIWKLIGDLAVQWNCQIIATTHSRECIRAFCDGLAETSSLSDMQYFRLDRVGRGIQTTVYGPDDLRGALDAEWELR